MISYPLAKRLKDAGFPQHDEMVLSFDDFAEHKDDARGLVQLVQSNSGGIYLVYDSSIGEELDELRGKPVEEWDGKGRPTYYFKRTYLESDEGKELTVWRPSLEELISACGNDFASLSCDEVVYDKNNPENVGKIGSWKALRKGWYKICEAGEPGCCPECGAEGASPYIAVAKLWLLLNKKL